MALNFIQPSPLYTHSTASRYVVSGESPLYPVQETTVELAGLGGAYVVSGAIPIGLCLGVVTQVQQTVIGCSGLAVGSLETPTMWGTLLYARLASGMATTDADMLAMGISRYAEAAPVVLQPSGGVFMNGRVLIRAHYIALG